ncbi:MAG: acVLRF1 family peptidyl-tRNA hydrolase [Nocardioidaceae bacterium]
MTVPFGRVSGWIRRYDAAHPGTTWTVSADSVAAASPDGTTIAFAVPMGPLEERSVAGLVSHLAAPWQVGVVLVRRGGFAVARVVGPDLVTDKVGKRHVQGKTKAGGWSQHRFANRRDNQARAAFDAAAGHVERILLPDAKAIDLLALGGDRRALAAVLAHRTLAALAARPQRWLGGVPDPSRAVLLQAIERARSVEITITDPRPLDG